MKGSFISLGLLAAALALILAFGNSRVGAFSTGDVTVGGAGMSRCEAEFKSLDPGHTGYLTFWDFRDGFNGESHKGLSPSGNAQGAFARADRNGDNLLTAKEYCDWKNRP